MIKTVHNNVYSSLRLNSETEFIAICCLSVTAEYYSLTSANFLTQHYPENTINKKA